MIFYSIYYLSIIFLLIADYLFKNIKLFLYLALFLVVVISGTRYGTGYDFFNYVSFYTHSLPENLEPLFKLSIIVLKQVSSDSQIMFFLYSFFTVILTYIGITKYTKYTKTSFLIFLLIPGLYLNSFSILRQAIAEPILFLAFFYLIYNKSLLRFYLLSLVAFLFHYSAILPVVIVLISYSILKKSYSLLFYILVLCLNIILYQINLATFLLGFAFGKYVAYLDFIQHTSLLKIVVSNLFILILIFFKNQFISTKEDNIILNILFIGIVILNIFSDFTPITRLSYYFLIFQIILVPKLIYSFKNNNIKIIALTLFISYYCLMFGNALVTDMATETDAGMIPYKNYFLKD